MSAAAMVLFVAAGLMFGFGPAFLLALAIIDRREQKAERRRRGEQERQVSPEWLAVLAATDTPIFAEVWAESLRRDLEEWSA